METDGNLYLLWQALLHLTLTLWGFGWQGNRFCSLFPMTASQSSEPVHISLHIPVVSIGFNLKCCVIWQLAYRWLTCFCWPLKVKSNKLHWQSRKDRVACIKNTHHCYKWQRQWIQLFFISAYQQILDWKFCPETKRQLRVICDIQAIRLQQKQTCHRDMSFSGSLSLER